MQCLGLLKMAPYDQTKGKNKPLILYTQLRYMDAQFSAKVKEIISYSREEALRLGNEFIGIEHLILGMIRDGQGLGVRVLQNLNVDMKDLRAELEQAIKNKGLLKNVQQVNSLPLTRQAERVIRITVLEAKACESVLQIIKSAPLIFRLSMCFTALDPPPPIPITLMMDLKDVSGTTSI